jgi:hydantoinase/carbamoylase family amidase
MSDPFPHLRIDEDRFRAGFDALSRIGATPDGGAHRPALSEDHLGARAWFHERAERAELEVHVDGAGNHSARLRCGLPGARALLLGSHLDSVPHGGRYDGPLGVLCALEVLQTIREAGLSLAVDLEAIDLTDEEGAHVSMMGSRALTGALREEHLAHPHSGDEAFAQALARAGLTHDGILAAQRDPVSLAGYLEVHIEQGSRLERAGTDVGVVTGIVGITWYRLRFLGRADHSGTRPVAERRDAAQGACAFALAARETVLRDYPGCVVNVGDMRFEPGAFNVVPAVVTAALEYRSPDGDQQHRMERDLLDLARAQAERFDLELETECLEAIAPTPMDERVQHILASAAERLCLTHTPLPSGAGHDAQSFADLCPTGMVFVPSVGGYSHSPQERTRWADCVNGANVLLQAALAMGGAEIGQDLQDSQDSLD